MATKKRTQITSMIVVSDLHCGCQMGLCPPDGIKVDEGGHYSPNHSQKVVWGWWRQFWDEWVPDVTRGLPYDLLVNGDMIDNEHHGNKTLITNNISVQRKLAVACMQPEVEKCKAKGGRLFVVRGTDAHDGGSGQDVEAIAEMLGAKPEKLTGRFSRWELWRHLDGPNPNCLIHAMHHIGTTGSAQYETSAPNREMVAELVAAARTGKTPPLYAVRSHRHTYTHTPLACEWGEARCVVTPAWQAKTPFAYKIAGARNAEPQFGGIIIRNGEEECYHRKYWKQLSRPEPEV